MTTSLFVNRILFFDVNTGYKYKQWRIVLLIGCKFQSRGSKNWCKSVLQVKEEESRRGKCQWTEWTFQGPVMFIVFLNIFSSEEFCRPQLLKEQKLAVRAKVETRCQQFSNLIAWMLLRALYMTRYLLTVNHNEHVCVIYLLSEYYIMQHTAYNLDPYTYRE